MPTLDSEVMVRIPTFDPIDRGLAGWMHWAGKTHPEWDIAYYYQTAGVCETRNEIAAQFLASDKQVLWMIDHDVTPPENADILQVDAPVVAGLYGHYHPQVGASYQVYVKTKEKEASYRFYPVQEWPSQTEPFKADVAGTGCMVIRRAVLEKIRDEDKSLPFYFTYEGGRRTGEDFTFCAKVGGVTVLPTYLCQHARKVNLTELVPLTHLAKIGQQALAKTPQPTDDITATSSDIPPAPAPLDDKFFTPKNRRQRRKKKSKQ